MCSVGFEIGDRLIFKGVGVSGFVSGGRYFLTDIINYGSFESKEYIVNNKVFDIYGFLVSFEHDISYLKVKLRKKKLQKLNDRLSNI